MTENLRLKITEGQAIEISDGSMWMPTNYDGSTIGVTTFTAADAATLRTRVENGGWQCTSPSDRNCNDVVRSFDTAGSSSSNICDPSNSGGADKIPGTEQCYDTAATLDGDVQQIGVYYNWYTATAGRGTVETTETVMTSLCPKGWILPGVIGAIQSRSSYLELLTNTYGIEFSSDTTISNDVRTFPFSMIEGGHFQPDNASPIHQRYRGDYTSRNVASDTRNYRALLVGEGYVRASSFRKREAGSIRCVFYQEF